MTLFSRSFRSGLLVVAIVVGLAPMEQPLSIGHVAQASDGMLFPLAQVAPPLPSNVRKQSRMYYLETVVVLALFGGAIFAVCRGSRRS